MMGRIKGRWGPIWPLWPMHGTRRQKSDRLYKFERRKRIGGQKRVSREIIRRRADKPFGHMRWRIKGGSEDLSAQYAVPVQTERSSLPY